MVRALPKVSVVMSVYNGGRYVQQAVRSILGQTLSDFEFIIVNDGSSDNTLDILLSFDDPRIVIINNEENIGITKSLNRGIFRASGDYIARQDADDFSLPNRLELQAAFLDGNPEFGLVGSCGYWIDAEGALLREWHPTNDAIMIQKLLLSVIPFMHGTFMFRRFILDDLGGGYDERYPVAQDCDLLLRVSDRWEVTNLPEILYVHRRHKDTLTTRRSMDQKHYERKSQYEAVSRRIKFGLGKLGLIKDSVPDWIYEVDRKWLALRYIYWSAAARELGRLPALKLLLVAIALDPLSSKARSFIMGIVGRKMKLLVPRPIDEM